QHARGEMRKMNLAILRAQTDQRQAKFSEPRAVFPSPVRHPRSDHRPERSYFVRHRDRNSPAIGQQGMTFLEKALGIMHVLQNMKKTNVVEDFSLPVDTIQRALEHIQSISFLCNANGNA